MRLHRFYVRQAIDPGKDNVLSNVELAHQLRRVFRLQTGDKAIFFDGSGTDYVSKLVLTGNHGVTFHALESYVVKPHSSRRISLAVSLIKKDNFEWVIQKGTELGVSEFIPVISDRSEKKGFNIDRAKKIMIEACEQSGRGDIPEIKDPVTLSDFLAQEKRALAVFHTDGDATALKSMMDKKALVACIGPEGGWTEAEIEAFKERGATIARFDAPTLRAETAAVAAAALFLLL